jgi:hypothetical protein
MPIARSRILSIKCWRTPAGRLSQLSIFGISRHDFLGIGSGAEALGKVEKLTLLALLSLQAVLDQFHEHPVGAQPAGLRQAANPWPTVCVTVSYKPPALVTG